MDSMDLPFGESDLWILLFMLGVVILIGSLILAGIGMAIQWLFSPLFHKRHHRADEYKEWDRQRTEYARAKAGPESGRSILHMSPLSEEYKAEIRFRHERSRRWEKAVEEFERENPAPWVRRWTLFNTEKYVKPDRGRAS